MSPLLHLLTADTIWPTISVSCHGDLYPLKLWTKVTVCQNRPSRSLLVIVMRQVTDRGFLICLLENGLLRHYQQHLESSKQVQVLCPSIHVCITGSCFNQESTVDLVKFSTSLEILAQAHVTLSSQVTREPWPRPLYLTVIKKTSCNIFSHNPEKELYLLLLFRDPTCGL